MALSDAVEVANAALLKCGESRTITSGQLASPDSKESRLVAARLEPTKRALLRRLPWNFAMVRTKLTSLTGEGIITGITAANPAVVDTGAVAHGFVTGDYVGIEEVVGMTEANGARSLVTYLTDFTFELDSIDSSSYTAWSSAGICFKAPRFTFAYYHTLPTDCLKLVSLNHTDEWRLEGDRKIASDDAELEIYYVKDVALVDATADSVFTEALAQYLAYDICYALTQSQGLRRELKADFREMISRASFENAIEEPREYLDTSEWIESRFNGVSGGGARFPRDPMT